MDKEFRSKLASALGKLARGIPKTLTDEDRERRRALMQSLNQKRMEKRKAAALAA